MAHKIDLTGKRFGRWLVIKQGPSRLEKLRKRIVWECLCDCGKIRDVCSGSLLNGYSQSCGCLARELISKRRSLDLTGLKFNRWTVINKSSKKISGCIGWNCVCDCGTNGIIPTSNLTTGQSKSCGCLGKESTYLAVGKNLSGKRFGKLLVVQQCQERLRGYLKWECICDCGNTSLLPSRALLSGNTRSCGCSRKETLHKMSGPDSPSYDHTIDDATRQMRREKRQSNNDFRTWSYAIKVKDNFMCQKCHQRGGVLHSHHIKSWAQYSNTRYDLDNGICLCEKCHKKLHKIYGKDLKPQDTMQFLGE